MEYKEYKRLHCIIQDLKCVAVTNQDFEMASNIRQLEVDFFCKRIESDRKIVYNDKGHDDFDFDLFIKQVNLIKYKSLSREIKLKIIGL